MNSLVPGHGIVTSWKGGNITFDSVCVLNG
jgi:hypothetical protein